MNTPFLERIQEYSLRQATISLKELQQLHQKSVVKDSESDFFWQLQELKQQKIVREIDAITYKILSIFQPNLDANTLVLHQHLASRFDLSNSCIWKSDWYNQFSRHQILQNFTVIEIEKETTESVFYELKDMNFGEVFLILHKEDEAILDRYAFEAKNPIIIQKMISKAPKQEIKVENDIISVPYLEKMLVDLFVDSALLVAYKGAEQIQIFRNILLNYVLDFKKMFAYAKRRGKENQLKVFLFENFENEINQIFL
ncbi:DUF6577 family protein (plasmid) [Bernardetia sp. Wsw4-3y2]|uniref:DUF6577 family protein n=1 Tax=Bernardetia sp. Wsw4-3y2 TaxID=3127471 RepID=UPI0030CE1F2A